MNDGLTLPSSGRTMTSLPQGALKQEDAPAQEGFVVLLESLSDEGAGFTNRQSPPDEPLVEAGLMEALGESGPAAAKPDGRKAMQNIFLSGSGEAPEQDIPADEVKRPGSSLQDPLPLRTGLMITLIGLTGQDETARGKEGFQKQPDLQVEAIRPIRIADVEREVPADGDGVGGAHPDRASLDEPSEFIHHAERPLSSEHNAPVDWQEGAAADVPEPAAKEPAKAEEEISADPQVTVRIAAAVDDDAGHGESREALAGEAEELAEYDGGLASSLLGTLLVTPQSQLRRPETTEARTDDGAALVVSFIRGELDSGHAGGRSRDSVPDEAGLSRSSPAGVGGLNSRIPEARVEQQPITVQAVAGPLPGSVITDVMMSTRAMAVMEQETGSQPVRMTVDKAMPNGLPGKASMDGIDPRGVLNAASQDMMDAILAGENTGRQEAGGMEPAVDALEKAGSARLADIQTEKDTFTAMPPALQILSHLSGNPNLTRSPEPRGETLAAGGPVFSEAASASSTMKSVRIKLRPEELGDVEVTLRRNGTGLTVLINVAKPEAAEAVRQDMSILEERLGFTLASGPAQPVTVIVQTADQSTLLGQSSSQSDWQQHAGGAGTASGQSAERDGRSSSGKQDDGLMAPKDRSEDDDSGIAASLARGLIV